MPYVPAARRHDLRPPQYTGRPPAVMEGPGDLNFLLTTLALDYLRQRGLSYQTINDVMGAFSSAAQEFYRRVAAPYEDTKIAQNGDVY